MTINGDGLGAPGTRVTKRLGPDDEVWLYVWQAVVGAAALNLVLTCLLLTYTVVGWWSLAVFLGMAFELVGSIVLAAGRPQWPPMAWAMRLLGLAGVVIGLAMGPRWYRMITVGVQLVLEQFGAAFSLPWWAYAALGVALIAIAVKGSFKIAAAVLLALAITAVVLLSDGREWLQAWSYLKWLLVPYSWPVIGFALLLALAMGKEMLFPSLEWTFKPVSLEELRETGLIGLWLPGLVGREWGEPEDDEGIEITANLLTPSNNHNRPHIQRPRLPGDAAARAFYQAVHRGESFSLRTARKYGVSRKAFNDRIRQGFLDRGLADWNDERYPQQGVYLKPEGEAFIEHLALVGTTPSPTGV
jgi:hypothetical protein